MWLVILFVVVPATELYLLIEVGSEIGFWPTMGLIVFTGAGGAMLARAEGIVVLERIQRAVAEGRMPAAEVVDGVLILVAGFTLLTPGFLTDALGLLVLFPLTRPFFRRLAMRWVQFRIQGPHGGPPGGPFGPP